MWMDSMDVTRWFVFFQPDKCGARFFFPLREWFRYKLFFYRDTLVFCTNAKDEETHLFCYEWEEFSLFQSINKNFPLNENTSLDVSRSIYSLVMSMPLIHTVQLGRQNKVWTLKILKPKLYTPSCEQIMQNVLDPSLIDATVQTLFSREQGTNTLVFALSGLCSHTEIQVSVTDQKGFCENLKKY